MVTSKYPKPQLTLDMRGSACPGPILGAKRLLDDLSAGQVLLLISDCAGTRDDLLAWPRYADVEMLQSEELTEGGTGFYIRKGRTRRVSPNAVLDMRGAICPGPIVEAKRLLNGMHTGEVLQLASNCAGIRDDVTSWIEATGLELADARETAPGEYLFHIRKL